MQLKKSPKASLEDKKFTYVLMGLILVLSICYVAFEWTEKEVTKYEVAEDLAFIDEIDIQQTTQETPPPPPPPAVQEVEVLNVVEDDVETETIEINTEDDKDVEVVIAPPVEAPVEEEEEEVIIRRKKKKKPAAAPAGMDPMTWVWIGAGAAVALSGAAVATILLVKKQKKAGEAENPAE